MKERKRNRLKGYDYTLEGCYFITICTENRNNYFGKIIKNEMLLNRYGDIVHSQWEWLGKQYDYVVLDKHVVMPNHFHAILTISTGNGHDRSLQKIKSLSSLVGAFKTTSSKLIHSNGNPDFKWQKSFYDHIVRNEKSYNNIWEYIHYNPLKWEWDIENKRIKNPDKNYYTKLFK